MITLGVILILAVVFAFLIFRLVSRLDSPGILLTLGGLLIIRAAALYFRGSPKG